MTPDTPTGSAGDHRLGAVLGLPHADAPSDVMRDPRSWPRWAVLLPHALAATDHFNGHPGQLDSAARDDAAWLLDRAGTYLQVHARLDDALPLFERVLAITQAAHSPDHPDIVTTLNNLA